MRVSFSCMAQAGEVLTTNCFLTLTSITQIPRMLSTYAEEPEIRIRRSHPCGSTTSGAAQEEQERLRVMLRLRMRPIAYRIWLSIFHSRRHAYVLFPSLPYSDDLVSVRLSLVHAFRPVCYERYTKQWFANLACTAHSLPHSRARSVNLSQ